MNARRGFTLVEALLAIATLAMLAGGLAVLYSSGHQALNVQGDETYLCSALRSEMERTMALPFGQLTNAVVALSLAGRPYTSAATVAAFDVDGDGSVESNAVTVTVAISDRSLTVLRVDNDGRVIKH